jgi:hypothetical protein
MVLELLRRVIDINSQYVVHERSGIGQMRMDVSDKDSYGIQMASFFMKAFVLVKERYPIPEN